MQIEMDFDAMPGVIRLEPYLARAKRKRRARPPGAASIAVFPLSRCSLVQTAERGLRECHGKRKQRFWRETIAGLRRQLKAAGLPEQRITQELWSFHDAVERRLNGDRDDRHGGAA